VCRASSGSLGHGLSVATGMAVAARLRGYGDTRVWVLLGDQELNEGQIWEAAQTANHYGLGNLYAIVDRNEMGLDGHTEGVWRWSRSASASAPSAGRSAR
jgi:transketolase